jgi:hypothetical protein
MNTRVGTIKPKLLLEAILIGILLILPACSLFGPTISQAEVYRIYTSVAQTYAVEHPTPTTTPGTSTPIVTTATIQPSATIYKTAIPTSTYDYYATCHYSSLVTDETIPDGTEVFTDEEFDKTWEFYNNGTCAWSTSFSLVFVYGKRMGGANVSLDGIVAPGDYIHVTVELTAPPSEGEYTGHWQLMDPYARLFGEIPSVAIVAVDEPTKTPTRTLTRTPTKTSTPTLTRTNTPSLTSTFTPTLTPSVTPSPTSTNTEIPTNTTAPTATDTPAPTDTTVPSPTPSPT